MQTQVTASGITKEFGNIVAHMFLPNDYNNGKVAVQLRQEVKSIYPSKKASNSKSDSLFDDADFGGGQSYEPSIRTALMNVPKGTTLEQVQAKLDLQPNAILRKFISYNVEDVMTTEQQYAVSIGQQSLADFKARLQVKAKDGSDIVDKNGNIVVVYQQHFFVKEYAEDVDTRNTLELEESQPKKLTNLNKLVGAEA